MAFDLQEQEQLDQLKTFWERGGRWLALLIGLLVVGYLGYVGYNQYQQKQTEQAGVLFSQFNKILEQQDKGQALNKQDLDKVKAVSSELETSYAKSPYASRAALILARVVYEKSDLKTAKDNLLWVTVNSQEPALQALARLRFANILFDEKQYPAALAELDKPHDATFDAQYAELKGDIQQTKGDTKAARGAYKLALDKLAKDSPDRQILNIKLAALGD